jgi:predicted nuclease of predicted toxin-antitoxin system
VKFVVDAQLPARLATFLTEAGHDAVHTTQLPDGNRTTDATIAELADLDDRIVVTKDRAFRDGTCSAGRPGDYSW